MVTLQCKICARQFSVIPARAQTAKFCSNRCAGKYRSLHQVGEAHPRWQGGERVKTCLHCGKEFRWDGHPLPTWRKQKFCSKSCADQGGFRYEGEAHANYKPDSRRKDRRGKHGAWARAVISRDKATCQHCGARGIQLHAHHIKSFADYPELRWELSNGLTLCHRCHWAVHTASNANGVNSGNILPGNAGDNPEPSLRRKPLEGVTTSGRAYRRWEGKCDWCGVFISKRWSDTTGKQFLFCSKRCAGKHNANLRVHGSNAATSAPPERDEIV